MAIDGARECGNNLQKRRFARNGQPKFPQSFREIFSTCNLWDLRQQPKGMCEAFIVGGSFEAMFSGIGACSGDAPNICPASDQADDVIPLVRFRQRS
jgi:hypothetical protein